MSLLAPDSQNWWSVDFAALTLDELLSIPADDLEHQHLERRRGPLDDARSQLDNTGERLMALTKQRDQLKADIMQSITLLLNKE